MFADLPPFEHAITLLTDINKVAQDLDSPALQHPLSDAITLLDDAIIALQLTDDISDAWNIFTTAVAAVEAAADAITAFAEVIPGLDIVLDALDAVFTFIETIEETIDGVIDTIVPVINKILPIMKDILDGLNDIQIIIKDMAVDLPMALNTMKVLQAMAEIIETIKKVYQSDKPGTPNPVETRLQDLYNAYSDVNKDIENVSSHLNKAFSDLDKSIGDMKDIGDEIKKICGSGFKLVEQGFHDASKVFTDVEGTVKTIENTLTPVRWVLHAASSVINKVIGPIINAVMSVTGISKIKKTLVSKLKSDLGFQALNDFKSFNGKSSTGPHKTTVYKNNSNNAGSKKSAEMKAMWLDIKNSVQAYKRGNKAETVEDAMELLLTAITGTAINLETGPPPIQINQPKYNVPKVVEPPAQEDFIRLKETALESFYQQYKLLKTQNFQATDPYSSASAVMLKANELMNSLDRDFCDLGILNKSAESALTSMTTSAPNINKAILQLTTAEKYVKIPSIGKTEIDAIDMIAGSIEGIVSKLSKIYPSETQDLIPFIKPLQDVVSQIDKITALEKKLSPIFKEAPSQLRTTVTAIRQIHNLPSHAHSCTAIAASCSSTAQLMAMLYDLNDSLNDSYSEQLEQQMQTIAAGAQTETKLVNLIISEVNELKNDMVDINIASTTITKIYEDFFNWRVPIAAVNLPYLLDAAKYINAIDSILSPLSFLLKFAGCTSTSDSETNVKKRLLSDVYDATEVIKDFALIVFKDVLEIAPKALELFTIDALHLKELENALVEAEEKLQSNLTLLVSKSAQVSKTMSAIEKDIIPVKSYPWPSKNFKKQNITVQLSNAFVSASEAKKIELLIAKMFKTANNEGVPMPYPSQLVIQWREKYDNKT